jgi:hypothetical protein
VTGPVLVTGGTGQLATSLTEAAPAHGLTVHRVGRPQFDFDRPASAAESFRASGSSLVINAAAYTGVDAAEDNAPVAFRANPRRAGKTGPVVRGGVGARSVAALPQVVFPVASTGSRPPASYQPSVQENDVVDGFEHVDPPHPPAHIGAATCGG